MLQDYELLIRAKVMFCANKNRLYTVDPISASDCQYETFLFPSSVDGFLTDLCWWSKYRLFFEHDIPVHPIQT
jgi:hypothetical protein